MYVKNEWYTINISKDHIAKVEFFVTDWQKDEQTDEQMTSLKLQVWGTKTCTKESL